MTSFLWQRSNEDYRDRGKYRLDGRVVLITGSSAGIGKETARDMALRGATVIMANRNLQKTEEVIAQLCQEEGEKLAKEKFVVRKLDLSEFESVKIFANQIKSQFPVIDILINNAGYAFLGNFRERSVDGFELTLQTNHMSHFLLTFLLIDNILASPNCPRIINVSSRAHWVLSHDLDDLQPQYPNNAYGGYKAYSLSKLCNVLFTKTLSRKFEGKIRVYSLDPGIVSTEIWRYSSVMRGLHYLLYPIMKSEKQGALTTIYCAVSEDVIQHSGGFFENSRLVGHAKMCKDTKNEEKVWKETCRLLGVTWEFPELKVKNEDSNG